MDHVLRWFGLDPFTQVDRITGSRFVSDSGMPPAVLWAVVVLGLVMVCVNFLPIVKMRTSVRVLTSLFRAGLVGLFLLALMQVHWKLELRRAYAQTWLTLVDDSGSMRTKDVNGDSRFRAAVKDSGELRRIAGRHVKIEETALGGNRVGEEAGAKTPTHIQTAIVRELANRPNLQRMILLTDGRDLDKTDFLLAGDALKSRGVALDVVLYGTDKPVQDLLISAKPERNVIRLGEALFIRGAIKDPGGRSALGLTLEEDGKKVKSFEVPRESLPWFEVVYKPESAKLHRYELKVAADDANPDNNSVAFYADVRDEKINVLMIEGVPGFEFKLLKVALETDPLVHLVTVSHKPGGGVNVQGTPPYKNPVDGMIKSETDLFKYDIVILRDVPRFLFRAGGDKSETTMRLLVSFVQKRGGGLVMLGGQNVYRAGGYQDSPLAAIMPFDLSTSISKDSQFPGRFSVNVVNDQYNHPLLRLQPDDAGNRARWKKLQQLDGCNNVGAFRPLAQPLLTRDAKIRTATGATNVVVVPVLAYMDLGSGKVLASSVDTLWRWQLQPDFDPPTPLETLMANVIRYMAPEPCSRAGSVNVSMADPTPSLGQTVTMSTLLLEDNYEPKRLADLAVRVKKPDGQAMTLYPRDLNERPGLYEYRVLADQPGDWTVTAALNKTNRTMRFVVRGQDDEFADLSVDRQSMTNLTQAAGGQIVDNLPEWAKQADQRPVTKQAARDLELWNSPAILFLFILLVCADCYVRKRQGLA